MEEAIINTQNSGNTEEEQGISLTELLRAMRDKWKWFIISILSMIFLAALYLMHATPMFTRSVEILLKDESAQSISTDLSMLGIEQAPAEILNEMFVMTSPAIMEQVVIKLNLNEVYTYPKLLRKAQYYNNSPVVVAVADSAQTGKNPYSFRIKIHDGKVTLSKFKIKKEKFSDEVTAAFGQYVKTPVGTLAVYATDFLEKPAEAIGPQDEVYYSFTPIKACARSYCESTTSNYDEDRGSIVTLTLSATSAKKASDILDAIVDAYNQRWVAEQNKTSLATSRFIDERLSTIESELSDVETSITDYKSTHRMMDMDAMASLYLAQSTENQRTLNELAQEISIARYIKSELASEDITRMLPATAEIAGTNIQTLVTSYNTMVGDRNAKLQSLPEENPLIRQKTEAILNARGAILTSVDAALASLNKRYDAIQLIDRQTQANLATAPGQAKYLMSEERKQKVKEELYIFLLQRREENELNQAFTALNTRMVTEPYGPSAPTSPKKGIVLLLAIVMGILIPTLLVYVKEVTNTKVRSRKEIEDLPIPFLGEVPLGNSKQHRSSSLFGHSKPGSDHTVKREVVVRPHTGDITNEAFRMIRTNIDFMGSMDQRKDSTLGKTIMVVSLNPGSGKTYVSLNTAAIYAVKGKKVCLVDLDLRKGTVSLNAGNPAQGVTDYLIGKNKNIDQLVVRNVDGIAGFDILPEGIRPPNPTELLYSPNLEELIDELREKYDYVIFDCPPIEVVADARLLNPFIDMTIFVMRSGLFEKSDLNTLRNLYTTRRYNNLALVLNATDKVHGLYGAYGYGYGYGQRRSKKRK